MNGNMENKSKDSVIWRFDLLAGQKTELAGPSQEKCWSSAQNPKKAKGGEKKVQKMAENSGIGEQMKMKLEAGGGGAKTSRFSAWGQGRLKNHLQSSKKKKKTGIRRVREEAWGQETTLRAGLVVSKRGEETDLEVAVSRMTVALAGGQHNWFKKKNG